MTTYNTGNPIGSTDARDLYDNAQNFDTAVNTSNPVWVDRFGVARQSLASAAGFVIDTPWLNAEDFTTLAEADAAAAAANKQLAISTVWAVAAATTLTSAIKVLPGGGFSGSGALTISGPFEAGLYPVFAGTGTVSGLNVARPEWFGGKPDGVWVAGADLNGANATSGLTCTGTDSTTAIARAIASVQTRGGIIRYSAGTYLASAISWDTGVHHIGVGTRKTSVGGGATSGTVIKQINGTNADFVTTPAADAWIESASIEGIRFIGDATGAATAGAGLVVKKRFGENTYLKNVRFDYFPDAGVELLRGVQPGNIDNLHVFWNGYANAVYGCGLYITRESSDEMQLGAFYNVSGDDNKLALVWIKGGKPLSTAGGVLSFINTKSENGVLGLQPDVFVFEDCQGLGVNVFGASHIITGTSTGGNSIFRMVAGGSGAILRWSGVGAESTDGGGYGLSYILDDSSVASPVRLSNTGDRRYSSGAYSSDASTPAATFSQSHPFVPTAEFATPGTPTKTVSGKYSAQGNIIHFSAQVVFSALGGGAGALTIGGLPVISAAAPFSALAVRVTGLAAGVGASHIQAHITPSSSNIIVSKLASGSAVQLTAADLTDAASFFISGHYFTDAL